MFHSLILSPCVVDSFIIVPYDIVGRDEQPFPDYANARSSTQQLVCVNEEKGAGEGEVTLFGIKGTVCWFENHTH